MKTKQAVHTTTNKNDLTLRYTGDWEFNIRHQYMEYLRESDEQILINILKGKECKLDHNQFDKNHLITDRCIQYQYESSSRGNIFDNYIGWDHWNVRWLMEWIEEDRPGLFNRIEKLLVLK